jgi:hypothetical protein
MEALLLKLLDKAKASYHGSMQRVCAAAGVFLLGLAGSLAADAAPSHDDAFSSDGLFKADAATLKDTFLLAHPATQLDPASNALWCGTLQLCWNKAVDLVGEKLQFTTTSPVVDLLNREDFTAADLEAGSYVAIADFERNHVEDEIRAALEKTFGGAASPELIPPAPASPGPEDFVAYAYLFKNLAFANPFSDEVDLKFEGKPVKCFGFDASTHQLDEETRKQVRICDYRDADDFVIKIATKSAKDELILARMAPLTTLEDTIKWALLRADRGGHVFLSPKDSMSVPKLNFDLRRDFSELEGLVLKPSPTAKIKGPLVISKAEQLVRFQLNEKGAILKSEAVINILTASTGPHVEPPVHHLVFDGPFLLLLRQTGAAQPYLALWIGNTTLLQPKGGRSWSPFH